MLGEFKRKLGQQQQRERYVYQEKLNEQNNSHARALNNLVHFLAVSLCKTAKLQDQFLCFLENANCVVELSIFPFVSERLTH